MDSKTFAYSPCLTCQRVRDPKNCENKLCKEWQDWWIGWWEDMRNKVREKACGKGIAGNPISVGGTKYHHPDHVAVFLAMDPCVRCPWRDGLCPGSCETKQMWLEMEESIHGLEASSQG